MVYQEVYVLGTTIFAGSVSGVVESHRFALTNDDSRLVREDGELELIVWPADWQLVERDTYGCYVVYNDEPYVVCCNYIAGDEMYTFT